MLELVPVFQGIVERGLLFTMPVLAVYLSSRVIRFDDLTVEGSFGLGAAVTAVGLSYGIAWPLVIVMAMLAGSMCGAATGLLHTQLRLNALISGIIITTALFSVTLAMAGAHHSVAIDKSIFGMVPYALSSVRGLLILVPVVVLALGAIGFLLETQVGFLLRARGNNAAMLTHLGKSISGYTIGCLAFSNSLTALSGSLFVQYVGYFSIWAQVGVLITALAGLMISEIIGASFGIMMVLGPILYQALIAITFELEIDPTWNKLITAALMVVLFIIQKYTVARK